jgi:hypothetical protein
LRLMTDAERKVRGAGIIIHCGENSASRKKKCHCGCGAGKLNRNKTLPFDSKKDIYLGSNHE